MDFRLTVPSLASNCWPATPQELINEAFDKTRGQLEGLTGIIASETQPSVDDQDKMWVRLNPDGRAHGQFVFGAGSWNWENPIEANSSVRQLWVGIETDLWSYDGGDGTDPGTNTPTATTGAMWEVDTGPAGSFLAAVGTVPGSTPASVVAAGVAATNTSAAVTLDSEQVGPHTHPLGIGATLQDGNNVRVVATSGGADRGLFIGETGTAEQSLSVEDNEFTATQTPVPIVPPAWGFYVIKRTARTHYTP